MTLISGKVRFMLIAMSAVVTLSLSLASPANATTPGRNGRITFMEPDAAGFWQVWVANADLSGQRQLTHGAANSGWPVWSPDGKKIAFDTDRGDADPNNDPAINDIFTMNPDGSGLRNLTGSKDFSADAGWSPDSKTIAFDSDRGDYPAKQGIYVMRADGSHVRRVTSLAAGQANDLAPRFSPDGWHLVFTRYGAGDFGDSALFTVDVLGRHEHQLTSFAIGAGDADWAPDGRKIVFEAYPSASSTGNADVVPSGGGLVKQLTHDGSADPVWSPDGTKILFLHASTKNGEFFIGLATMKPDGSGISYLTSTSAQQHQPDWQSIRF